MSDPIALFRDNTHVSALAITKRRRVQRIVKKHLQQKYLLCGFAIHAFLASPVYLYGIIVDNNIELVTRIWPPIIYQAIGQICHSFLLHSAEKNQNRKFSQYENRRTFIIATFLICSSIILCGFLFSSAWIGVTLTTQIIAVFTYGLFGGIGSSFIYIRTYIIFERVRPKEDKYIQKTVHLCGEAFCQLFLSFVFTSLRTLYGISQTLILMAALLINLIPLGLLITGKKEKKFKRKFSSSSSSNIFQGVNNRITSHNMDQLDGIELQQTTWKNPHNSIEMRCNYMSLAMEEPCLTYFNSNGVEIMEIIPEEDENISAIRSSLGTFSEQIIIHGENFTNFEKIHEFSKNLKNHVVESMTDNIFIPLQRAIVIIRIYPATLLQSIDIFSYVICLTVLPGLAINKHALKFAEIPFLFSLLAFPWMCFALMTPKFGFNLVKGKNRWHALGCFLKGLALFFVSVSSSKLLLSLSAVLLGFGQAVSLFLQDLIIQSGIPKAQWIDVKYPLYFLNGVLILIWGAGGHLIIKNFGFQASVSFSALLYNIIIIMWYTLAEKFTKKKTHLVNNIITTNTSK